MTDKSEKTFSTWGYHRSELPQIFELKEGEKLPSGWKDSPAKFSDSDSSAAPSKVDGDSSELIAEHRGAGRYFIMSDGQAIGDLMTKEDAEAFNRMSKEDRAAYAIKKA